MTSPGRKKTDPKKKSGTLIPFNINISTSTSTKKKSFKEKDEIKETSIKRGYNDVDESNEKDKSFTI